MNIHWMFDWWYTLAQIEQIFKTYHMVMSDDFFDPERDKDADTMEAYYRATMWASRNEQLNVSVDLIRDLMWQCLENRYGKK